MPGFFNNLTVPNLPNVSGALSSPMGQMPPNMASLLSALQASRQFSQGAPAPGSFPMPQMGAGSQIAHPMAPPPPPVNPAMGLGSNPQSSLGMGGQLPPEAQARLMQLLGQFGANGMQPAAVPPQPQAQPGTVPHSPMSPNLGMSSSPAIFQNLQSLLSQFGSSPLGFGFR